MTRFFSNKPFFLMLVGSFFVLSFLTMNCHLYGSPNDPDGSGNGKGHVVSFSPGGSKSSDDQDEERGSRCCARAAHRVGEIWGYFKGPLQVGVLLAVIGLTYPFPYWW